MVPGLERLAVPEFVLNTRERASRAVVHRPRDSSVTFCGWSWAEAFAAGHAVTFERGVDVNRLCEKCTRLSCMSE